MADSLGRKQELAKLHFNVQLLMAMHFIIQMAPSITVNLAGVNELWRDAIVVPDSWFAVLVPQPPTNGHPPLKPGFTNCDSNSLEERHGNPRCTSGRKALAPEPLADRTSRSKRSRIK
jgi:hypothetical protein